MKSNEVKRTVEQLAAEAVAGKHVELSMNEEGGINIAFDDCIFDRTAREFVDIREAAEVDNVDVVVYRGRAGKQQEIMYFVKIYTYGRERSEKFFVTVKTAEEAYTIKDLLDDMIAAFKEGRTNELL